jgi:hypothetical protein
MQTTVGMNNGIDGCTDPKEKQYKSGDESSGIVGPLNQQ